MFSTEEGEQICVVRGGQSDGEFIFLTEEAQNKSRIVKGEPIRDIYVEDGKFEQLPNSRERIMYICGPAGSGKSTMVASYARNFKKLYPDCKCILFSKINDDPAFEELEFKKIDISDDEVVNSILEKPLEYEEADGGSLIVFDDMDTISNKKLLESLINFQSQLLELGRHKNIKIIITSHLIIGNNRKFARTILNEMQAITVFCASGSTQQITYAFKTYLGMDTKQIAKVLKINSRWVTIIKSYPQILISEHRCVFLSNL